MADIFTKEKRRQIMQSVRRQNTAPETLLCHLLREPSVRFHKHPTSLPGRPDLYIRSANIVAFVHGCFWHGHNKCNKGKLLSKTNAEYWKLRIARNKQRDRRVTRQLRQRGLRVYTIWECELKTRRLPNRLLRALSKP